MSVCTDFHCMTLRLIIPWRKPHAAQVWYVNDNSLCTGSGYGLLPDGTNPLPEPMVTYFNWGLGNKLQWNLHQNAHIFIQENAFENDVCKMLVILYTGLILMRWYGRGCNYIIKLNSWRGDGRGIVHCDVRFITIKTGHDGFFKQNFHHCLGLLFCDDDEI